MYYVRVFYKIFALFCKQTLLNVKSNSKYQKDYFMVIRFDINILFSITHSDIEVIYEMPKAMVLF